MRNPQSTEACVVPIHFALMETALEKQLSFGPCWEPWPSLFQLLFAHRLELGGAKLILRSLPTHTT